MEARQDHFRGGVDEPLSAADLEAKYRANCAYGGWSADQAEAALRTVRTLPCAARVDLSALRA